jgi:hypothetical protein
MTLPLKTIPSVIKVSIYIITIIKALPVGLAALLTIIEIPPNKYVGEVCTSAKVSNTDRGIPMIFSVTTEQCTTGTTNGVLMMKRQLKCNREIFSM